jgi:hypothetical protein
MQQFFSFKDGLGFGLKSGDRPPDVDAGLEETHLL